MNPRLPRISPCKVHLQLFFIDHHVCPGHVTVYYVLLSLVFFLQKTDAKYAAQVPCNLDSGFGMSVLEPIMVMG